jgi:hypothetical protein
MRFILSLVLSAISAFSADLPAPPAGSDEAKVKLGDSRIKVEALLGEIEALEPVDRLRTRVCFKRCTIIFESGKVVQLPVMRSPEELAKLEQEKAKAAQDRAAAAQAQKESKEQAEKALADKPPVRRTKADHDRAKALNPAARFAMKYQSAPASKGAPVMVKDFSMTVVSETAGVVSSSARIGGGGGVFAYSYPVGCKIKLSLLSKSNEGLRLPSVRLLFSKDGSTEEINVKLKNTDSFMDKGVPCQFDAEISFTESGMNLDQLSDFDRVTISLFSGKDEIKLDRPLWLAAGVK